MTATGMVMISQTQNPNAAWKVFEWYNAGQPSIDRAGSGWGVPALKSQFELMPKESPYQQQVQKVLASEIAVSDKYLQFNPFLGEASFVDAWNRNLDQALRDEITFDECLANVESEVNTLIQEGIDRLS
jgi:multiple sugar transport system substrate-binding protein